MNHINTGYLPTISKKYGKIPKKGEFGVEIQVDLEKDEVWVFVKDHKGRIGAANNPEIKFVSDLNDDNVLELTMEAKKYLLSSIETGTQIDSQVSTVDYMTKLAYKAINPRK